MSNFLFFIQLLISFLPFILFVFLNGKANMKKEIRNRQYLMPLIAVVYSIVLLIFLDKISSLLSDLFLKLADLFEWIRLPMVGDFIRDMYSSWGVYLTSLLFNTGAMIAFITIKRILTLSLSGIKIKRDSFIGSVVEIFYTYDEQDECWYVKQHFGQARTFIKASYYASAFVAGVALLISFWLCMNHLISVPFYPVFAVIVIGEIAYFIDGLEKEEQESKLSVSADRSTHIAMYPLLRKPLKALFGDKLSAEGTTVNNVGVNGGALEDILVNFEKSGTHIGKNYAAFIRKKMSDGLKPNVDYVRSGYELATGKSLLFNTPFYDKLNPYVFYAMNRALLTGGKVMIVLGRHGTEEDLYQWCENGMRQVANIPDLWNIAVLDEKKIEDDEIPDIGIISRSNVHNLSLHKNNLAFLKEVSFVMVVEPSRLVTTAQIGLNLLIKNCGKEKPITFCSMDCNCDGLVDALSHILMTNITEVSATEYPHGMSSFMYWTADGEYLQHRILPGVSRFLGMGTELSAVALRNQVKKTVWYGGDSFPVRDARWIAKQYYYDLLDYAHLPTTQETFDNSFQTSFNMCNERVSDYSYVTVEDDRNNLFEVRRNFATIAEEQGFVNVISSEYMLREYMSENNEIFTIDAKAIPYITADYARTKRNLVLTLCLLLCVDTVQEDILRRHIMLLNLDTEDLKGELWREICVIFSDKEHFETDKHGNTVLSVKKSNGSIISFKKDETILYKRIYSIESGQFENVYTIENEDFIRIILDDLQNASYIAEQDSKDIYIGTELKGHVYQKYLPGQFFTLNGKYYEMVSTTADDSILVRRAADHIDGRLSYRQVRNYTINHLEDSQTMGALKTVNNIDIHYQYADFVVETPGYWKLGAYNDFDNGDLIMLNGVPVRKYQHKQILKFDFSKFGDAFTDSVRMTLTNLLNEVFVTLFADNRPFISAITPGQFEAPMTYSLNLAEDIPNADKCIFIIEDSQLDIGLLIAVERNIKRIFQIVSDYLSWNDEMIEESLNKKEEPPVEEKPAFDVYEGSKPEKKKNIFRRVADWFKGLFKKKDKNKPVEVPAQDYMMIYGKPHKLVNGKWVACSQEEFDAKMEERHRAIEEKKAAEKAEREEGENIENPEDIPSETSDEESLDETEEVAEVETEEQTAEESATEETEEAPPKLGWFARRRAAKAEKKKVKAERKSQKEKAKEESEDLPALEDDNDELSVEIVSDEEIPNEEISDEEISVEEILEETSDEEENQEDEAALALSGDEVSEDE